MESFLRLILCARLNYNDFVRYMKMGADTYKNL